jgi:hypothetical protein
MDLGTAKNALRTAREAWHKAIDVSYTNRTTAAHNKECNAIDNLERAILDLQRFLPDYDPEAVTGLYAADP